MPSFPKRDRRSQNRILKKPEFDRLRDSRKTDGASSLANFCFVLRWISGDRRRLGLVVSSKAGKAVQRNLIKRIVKEYFRLHPEQFPFGDVVVIAKPSLNVLKGKDIRLGLIKLLEKLKR